MLNAAFVAFRSQARRPFLHVMSRDRKIQQAVENSGSIMLIASRCLRWKAVMHGGDEQNKALFSYVSFKVRVPPDHPLRPILNVAHEALDLISSKFDQRYDRISRPITAQEKLLRHCCG